MLRRAWHVMRGNPILRLELRRLRRRRGWPGAWFSMCCLLICPLLVGLATAYIVVIVSIDALGEQPEATILLGLLVVGLPMLAVALLSFALPWLAPALTAASIAREREMGTIDALRTTLLPEWALVLGKFGAFLAQIWPFFLPLVLLTPFQLVQYFGSGLTFCVSPETTLLLLLTGVGGGSEAVVLVVMVALRLLSWALGVVSATVFHGALGIFVSALCRSSRVAVAASYGTVVAFRVTLWILGVVGGYILMIALVLFASLSYSVSSTPSPVWLLLSAGGGMLAMAFLPAVGALAEFAGTGLLLWGATQVLKRV